MDSNTNQPEYDEQLEPVAYQGHYLRRGGGWGFVYGLHISQTNNILLVNYPKKHFKKNNAYGTSLFYFGHFVTLIQ